MRARDQNEKPQNEAKEQNRATRSFTAIHPGSFAHCGQTRVGVEREWFGHQMGSDGLDIQL